MHNRDNLSIYNYYSKQYTVLVHGIVQIWHKLRTGLFQTSVHPVEITRNYWRTHFKMYLNFFIIIVNTCIWFIDLWNIKITYVHCYQLFSYHGLYMYIELILIRFFIEKSKIVGTCTCTVHVIKINFAPAFKCSIRARSSIYISGINVSMMIACTHRKQRTSLKLNGQWSI